MRLRYTILLLLITIAAHSQQTTLQLDSNFSIKEKIGLPVTYSEVFGYTKMDFKFRDRECHVVCPARAAEGHPWIWRARFFLHEPQTDIALLERGYHVVYCDVAELLGNEEAIGIWNGFYKLLHDAGLSKRAVMEGMSRGGMYVFNWAAVNPDKVAAVYVDNPLLNLSHWLLNQGKQPGWEEAFKSFSKPFNLKTDEEIRNFKGNPVDKTKEIVKGKYPILILCADQDEAVSHEENTDLFAERIKAAGGEITVMYKRGFKHHPHSFPDPAPIVDFIVKAVNRPSSTR